MQGKTRYGNTEQSENKESACAKRWPNNLNVVGRTRFGRKGQDQTDTPFRPPSNHTHVQVPNTVKREGSLMCVF